jgi:hypothetical protein
MGFTDGGAGLGWPSGGPCHCPGIIVGSVFSAALPGFPNAAIPAIRQDAASEFRVIKIAAGNRRL